MITPKFSTKFVRSVAVLALAGILAACSPQYGGKQAGGTLIGAGLGGLLGSKVGKGKGQLAGVAVGALLGALVGNQVGKSLDQADRLYAQRASQRAMETAQAGEVTEWRNPDSGNSGTIVPTRTYESAGGQYCREYQQTITVGGRTQQAYGTACRQPDGSWKIRSNT